MKIRTLVAAATLSLAFGLSGQAHAQMLAYSAPGLTNLRAGPGLGYAIIAKIGGGTRLYIYGCLETRSWCDALVGDFRGWIAASRLEFVYAGRRVYVPDYYSYFNPPTIEFYFDNRPRRRHRERVREPVTPPCPLPPPNCLPLGPDTTGPIAPGSGGETIIQGGPDYPPTYRRRQAPVGGPDYPPTYAGPESLGGGETIILPEGACPPGDPNCRN
ncbi:MAG: SH3 domain-containing protein [Propylenella sp.]